MEVSTNILRVPTCFLTGRCHSSEYRSPEHLTLHCTTATDIHANYISKYHVVGNSYIKISKQIAQEN